MFDTLIKNGMLVDGTGAPPRRADIGIRHGKVVAIGEELESPAGEVIDAGGKLVTPGFIDIHTHFDGQVTWDDQLLPSSAHGVTTIVTGCCGIGFAPVRPGSEDWLIDLTEGVEDIPGTALHDGIPWGWETFPEYLDFLASRSYAVDIAAQAPHSAIRAYVLGERARTDEPATAQELEQMKAIVREAIAAGAVGLGTSRVSMHRAADGGILPGTNAVEEELLALTEAMRDGGGGVLQLIPSGTSGGGHSGDEDALDLAPQGLRDQWSLSEEVLMMRRLYERTGQPITFTMAETRAIGRRAFDAALDIAREAQAAGARIHPQTAPRPVGALSCLDGYHIFTAKPSYRALAHLPAPERAARMRDPQVRQAILSEDDLPPTSHDMREHFHTKLRAGLQDTYVLETGNEYEPDPRESVVARAAQLGISTEAFVYDVLTQGEGDGILIWLISAYMDGDLRKTEQAILDPHYMLGLGDAGAHVQLICDASFPTFLLSHWGLRRSRGSTLPIELLVRKITKDAADLYGFADRGVIAQGMRADLNVIDLDALTLTKPRLVFDLPSGAQRFLQDPKGYAMTMVGGVITRRDDADTGARPGRLVRKPAA